MGAFDFETISYYVAQASLNLGSPALVLGKVDATVPNNKFTGHTMAHSSKAGSVHVWLSE